MPEIMPNQRLSRTASPPLGLVVRRIDTSGGAMKSVFTLIAVITVAGCATPSQRAEDYLKYGRVIDKLTLSDIEQQKQAADTETVRKASKAGEFIGMWL